MNADVANGLIPSSGLQFCFRKDGSVERLNVVAVDPDEGAVVLFPSGLGVELVSRLEFGGERVRGVVMPATASSSVIESALRRSRL